MVGSKENYKFDVGVKGLIIYLLGLILCPVWTLMDIMTA